ncbi:Hypothetical predicted protein [Mytilus galloprovincialis]|uniref:Tudor domain-containing protein n=1 Tax=Mytilus galloprovincialis TaxID=29158 RepID=A0A8B6HNH9_MYTGA|nr:Hypothetical predicted protein [Mytilus galloprovincialis]
MFVTAKNFSQLNHSIFLSALGTQEGETAEVADETRETYPDVDYSIADYVAAIYLNKWYIAQIKTIDIEDNTIEISFLEKKKAMFQWPSRSDIIWVDRKDILCKISNPQPSVKSKRMLKVNHEDAAKIEKL